MGRKEGNMHSPCLRACCINGCCPNPFHGLPESSSSHAPNPKSPHSAAVARQDFKVFTISSIFPDSQFTNHESLPSLHESFSNFTKVFPQYSQTDETDQIRAREYFHLSLSNHVCLDYIGHGLFSYSQLEKIYPKEPVAASSSSSSTMSLQFESPFFDISYKSVNLNTWIQYGGEESELESQFRKRIMAFMNICEEDYTMVFTANQSSAFKVLAESYPFYSNKNLLTVYDYENEAVEMMVESSKKRGARVMSAEFSWPNLRIQSGKLMKKIVSKRKKTKRGLFVFPIQSRMTGARYSYQWMSMAQEKGWHVLLDASALGPKDMDTLGLSLFKPDFLICSFYKIFGENPSGFGCLFIKKSSASVLNESTVGIVNLVPAMRPSPSIEDSTFSEIELHKHDDDIVTGSIQQMSDETSEIHEAEKTRVIQKELSFSELVELEKAYERSQSKIKESGTSGKTELECKGLDHADSLGLILISNRTRYLINWLVNALMSLQHPHSENGLPPVRIYGPKVMFDRGPAIAFDIYDWKGEKIDPPLVQKLADRYNISLSYGTLQHIWFSDRYAEDKEIILKTRTAAEEETTALNKSKDTLHSGISVVTASLGLLTNFEDIYRLWAFISRFLDADFVEKEKWRYMALNQKTVEI